MTYPIAANYRIVRKMNKHTIIGLLLLLFLLMGTIIMLSNDKDLQKENKTRSNFPLLYEQNKKEENQKPQIFSEVWSQHSPYGTSYEFKVNCYGNYTILNECFLWDIDLVTVQSPNNTEYTLKKDFNINSYSGEITRRWVLYGPQNGSLPIAGNYQFHFTKNKTIMFTDTVNYSQSLINFPTLIHYERKNNDLLVYWTPPTNIPEESWYKVILWNEADTPSTFISQQFPRNASTATLPNVPLIKEGNYSLNVALFYRHGYSYSEYTKFTW
ncbi:MAG TPA: hypothetical protein VJK51_00130 [Candidatus Nanoarchaeia archaeon]|nr:hypothetical protein [Candidatus Nanoarchaeia archaeon]